MPPVRMIGRHRQRQQADFDGVPDDVERVVERAEVASDSVEVEPLEATPENSSAEHHFSRMRGEADSRSIAIVCDNREMNASFSCCAKLISRVVW